MGSFKAARILVFGATGAIGKYITEGILASKPSFEHVTIFTSASTATTKAELLNKWKSQGASVVVGDLTSQADVAGAYKSGNIDTAVSCLGRGALELQTMLIQQAEASDTVKWFFPSEYGTDVEHGPQSVSEKPHQVKLALRKFIREQIKNLQVTYLVTGPYFDMWVNLIPGLEPVGGFNVATKEARLIDNGTGPIGFCTMHDVGTFLAAALHHPEASFGKALKVQSFVVTPKEVLAEYEKQTGAKWTVHSITLQELRELETKYWADGHRAATGATLRRIWAEGGTLYAKNDNDVIGLGPNDLTSLESAVKMALSKANL